MGRGTVLITGASAGLGAEMARQFAARGWDLALCARRGDRLDALRDEIVAAHPDRRVEARVLDVTEDDQVFAVFRQFAAVFGGIGLVIVSSMSALRGMRRAMVAAIERRRVRAYVPAWPWVPIGLAMRMLPLSVVRRLV